MSRDYIVEWAQQLSPSHQRAIALRLSSCPGSEASGVLMAWAEDVGIRCDELSALLPGILVQARVIASHLMAEQDMSRQHMAGQNKAAG